MLKYEIYEKVKRAVKSVYSGKNVHITEIYSDTTNTVSLVVTTDKEAYLDDVVEAISDLGYKIDKINLSKGRLELKFKLNTEIKAQESESTLEYEEDKSWLSHALSNKDDDDISIPNPLAVPNHIYLTKTEDYCNLFSKLFSTVEGIIINGLYDDGRKSNMINFHNYLTSINERHLPPNVDGDQEKTHIGNNVIEKYASGKAPTPSKQKEIMRNTYSYEILLKITEIFAEDEVEGRKFLYNYHTSRAAMEKL